jgi:hypothetical protein
MGYVLASQGGQSHTSSERIDRLKFAAKLKKLEGLFKSKFADFDFEANVLVNKLYGLRNRAAHGGLLPIEDPQKSRLANAAELHGHVRAVEKLFAWLEIQRSRILQTVMSNGAATFSSPERM